MNFTRKVAHLNIVLAAIFLLTACDGSKPFKDLQVYIDQLKQADVQKDADGSATRKPAVQPDSAKYVSEARRSPFEVMEVAPAKGRATSNPLQAYPLDMLRFVGTVTQNGSTIAFISAPDNKIYQIKAGDVIGDRDSEVITIAADRVSLMEQYSENGSAAMKRVVTLQLKESSQ